MDLNTYNTALEDLNSYDSLGIKHLPTSEYQLDAGNKSNLKRFNMDYYHPQEDHSNMLPLVSGQHHQQQPPLIQSPAIPAPSSAPVSSASSAADDAVLLAMSDFSTYQHFNQFQFNDSLSGPLHTSPAPVQQILSDHTVSVAPTQEQPQHVSWRHTQQQIQQQLAQQRRDSLIYQQQQQQRQQQQQAVRTMHQPQMYLPRQLSVSQIPTSFQNTVVHPAPTRQQQQQQQLPSSQHHALPQQHLPRTSPVYQQYYSLVDLNGASSIGPMTHQPFSASSNLTLPATTGSPAHTNFSYQQHYTNGYPGLMPHSSPIPSMAHYPYPQQQHLDSTPNQKKRKGGDLEEYVHEFPAPKKKTKTKKKRAKQPAEPVDPNAPPKPKRKTGLNKPLILSAALSAFVGGDTELSRPEIVKKLWKYIKDNDLQDPADRRYILCDEKLKTIFDQDRINSFGMNRDLSAHLTKKPEPTTTSDDSFESQNVSNTKQRSSSDVLDTSPAVTAETPDVVTPKEGEGMLPATAAPTTATA